MKVENIQYGVIHIVDDAGKHLASVSMHNYHLRGSEQDSLTEALQWVTAEWIKTCPKHNVHPTPIHNQPVCEECFAEDLVASCERSEANAG